MSAPPNDPTMRQHRVRFLETASLLAAHLEGKKQRETIDLIQDMARMWGLDK